MISKLRLLLTVVSKSSDRIYDGLADLRGSCVRVTTIYVGVI
ncbi:hypothetical protein [Nostoc sp.]